MIICYNTCYLLNWVMCMRGFKCFNSDMTNLYGEQFEIGKKYKVNGPVKVGVRGNGFHICVNIEDTLKYFGALNPDIVVCEVVGNGEILSSWDDYYGFEKFAVSELEIMRIIPREEIIQMALQFSEDRALRFVQLFKLTEEEIKLFEEKFNVYLSVLKAIEYYQKNNKSVYELEYKFGSNYLKRIRWKA